MSISIDNKAAGKDVGGSVSFSFTVANNPNTVLLLGIFMVNTAAGAPGSVQYAGVTMSGVASNVGPINTYGFLGVYSLSNPSTGTNNLTLSTGADATEVYHVIYSYYNVGSINATYARAQGTFSASSVSQSLTAAVNNSVLWAVAAGHDNTGNNISNTAASFNQVSSVADVQAIQGGDSGVVSAGSSATSSSGDGAGNGYADVILIELDPIPPPASASPGSLILLSMV
jgi:hypothetical protein